MGVSPVNQRFILNQERNHSHSGQAIDLKGSCGQFQILASNNQTFQTINIQNFTLPTLDFRVIKLFCCLFVCPKSMFSRFSSSDPVRPSWMIPPFTTKIRVSCQAIMGVARTIIRVVGTLIPFHRWPCGRCDRPNTEDFRFWRFFLKLELDSYWEVKIPNLSTSLFSTTWNSTCKKMYHVSIHICKGKNPNIQCILQGWDSKNNVQLPTLGT